MTYLVFLGLLGVIILALRSYFRYKREQAALTEEFRQAVARQGWTYEKNPGQNLQLRIKGTSEGVSWSVEQDDGVGDDSGASITWSTGLVDTEPLLLYVADVQTLGAMQGLAGELLMQFAVKVDRRGGEVIQVLRDFLKHAEPHAFISPNLRMRYAVLASSPAFARQMLQAPFEKTFQEWPDSSAKLQIGADNVRIHWRTSDLKCEDVLRLTELGVLLAKRLSGAVQGDHQH